MEPDLGRRLACVRANAGRAGLDAFVVSHLPNVRYLTGFVGTAGSLILTPDRATLIVDFRYATAAQDVAARAGRLFDVAVAERNADETIVATLREFESRRIGIEAAEMPVARFNRLSAALVPQSGGPMLEAGQCPSLVPVDRLVESIRQLKDGSELAALREGARRLSAVARGVRQFLVAGRSEREIARDIDDALRDAGFERPAFETIVASGPNSALPHARPTGRILQKGEGAVLDFGGVYDGYCVDLTRTLHLGARPAALRRIFAAVVEAHAAALEAVRPGVRASAVDAAARDVLIRQGLGDAFGHGTGHGLGLEVHEEPRLTRAGTAHPDTLLEAGMVFTIEPGAYVPGVGGVRIEDDVVVVPEGAELLTDVPIEL